MAQWDSHLQLSQEFCGGAGGVPIARAKLGVQVGAELFQGLTDRFCLFLELRSLGGQGQSQGATY